MKSIDHLSLDGRLLAMFVSVYEEGSVTAAALRMKTTQSTISHALNRLREMLQDPLFVQMGRGITPTERAHEIVGQARDLLSDLEKFTQSGSYDPAAEIRPFVLAASDYEAEIIGGPLSEIIRVQAPKSRLENMRARSQSEWPELLRIGHVDLILSIELESQDSDLIQQRLFQDDGVVCFYDADQRSAPDTLDAYCAAQHVIVTPGRFMRTSVDMALTKLGRERHIAVSMPSFAIIGSLLRGTDLVASMPGRLRRSSFRGLAECQLPIELPTEVISQTWHIRSNAAPRHRWLREHVKAVAGRR